MRLEFQRHTERLGTVRINDVQKVFELDSGVRDDVAEQGKEAFVVSQKMNEDIEGRMAVVVPVKQERLRLLEGVLSAIPHGCLTIVVSNSERKPVDRYRMETEMISQFNRPVGKKIIVLHQKDPGAAKALRDGGYSAADDKTIIREGKGEGMLLGMLLAKALKKDYVGFIDADNFSPGAVHEYVRNFVAGFSMSSSPYAMVRVSWIYKPKATETGFFFSKWGRVSEYVNRYLNSLIASYTSFGTDIIKTANSGEHAMTMRLAELLTFSSGFSVEPFELLNILEQFSGIKPSSLPEVMKKGVEIYQIQTRNPHFHEDKGDDHVRRMLLSSLGAIYNSDICPPGLKSSIVEELSALGIIDAGVEPPTPSLLPPFGPANADIFLESLRKDAKTLVELGF